ncbi:MULTISPECIES: MacB family efflux pump subunit [unclassified Oceanobacter]|uniref:MacB family efflux pump subunit n=1 Tax=unclassified Oceanobacter TaxID=2620260 RepID=UPI0026E2213E|nr:MULTISPECIES: MacB family efflux pump subunit [unclassified Oceanobacter]MDO6682015.1 MacB family efflux pump subunit [Oceanobacter sp. 5_MG-2023]MDP2610095.1 MacB family efflux pump subunit [Oceanobacter sp. 1_MG-2023]MDP2612330.1 MacB family efflux pump subunit [Oceanobacter sp. 2_MG-2023]
MTVQALPVVVWVAAWEADVVAEPNTRPQHELISLRGVCRYYQAGDVVVKALDNVSLTIRRGEFVAVMGQSGSGKSTLMNILGCLDHPTSGEYRVNGHDVNSLSPDQLAALRLKTFGFVFQRYQLLANLTAQENVALPSVYAHTPKEARHQRAAALLDKLGVAERMQHTPAELSGGQQQRVSIARAMINGADVILADEPTGALDSATGVQVLDMLRQLNAEGVTVILITHDAEVAAAARRQIQIHDGRILSDSDEENHSPTPVPETVNPPPLQSYPSVSALVSVMTALQSLKNNWFRTLLTLLGIVIGVAAVVAMMAIGEGGKQQVLDRIESMGTNLLLIRPGGANNRNSGATATLSREDAALLAELPGVEVVSPERNSNATIRFGNRDYSGRIRATTEDYLRVKDWQLSQGTFFTSADMDSLAPLLVVGQTIVDQLFVNGENPIGQYVFMKNGMYLIVGVLEAKGATAGGNDMDEEVLVPLSTGMVRIFGREYLSSITVKVEDTDSIDQVEAEVTQLLTARHGSEDFTVRNTASLIEAISETQDTLTWLLGSVAAISLFVGGIGVMNIMLVSVSERRREIGLRIATGAKPSDILQQFNIEALVVCCLGGVVGLMLGGSIALIMGQMNVAVAFSWAPPLMAFASALLVGLVFGHAPARKASRLNPIDALAED